MPDIFDEVEEDLRADRFQRLLRQYGSLLAAFALAVVLGVGGWQGWRWWQDRKATAAAESFIAAGQAATAEGADLKAAADRFAQVARDAPAGYRALSLLRGASLKLAGNDLPGALALWDQLSKDSGVEPLYRDLGTLLWGLHGLGTTDPAQIEARLAPLAVPGNPWQASVREVRALAALQRGNTADARQGLQALANDVTAPQGVRERAGRLLAGLGS